MVRVQNRLFFIVKAKCEAQRAAPSQFRPRFLNATPYSRTVWAFGEKQFPISLWE